MNVRTFFGKELSLVLPDLTPQVTNGQVSLWSFLRPSHLLSADRSVAHLSIK